MSFNIEEYFSGINDSNTVLAFKGNITAEVINQSLESVENKLTQAGEDSKIIKKIYNVLVEGLQNLFHHVDELPDSIVEKFGHKFAVFSIQRIDGGYRVVTGNFIPSEKIKFLKDKIDKINSLSEEELKDMYKFILNHQKLSAKGGGGLGLVDIARKTKNKLDYTFQSFNDDYYFFNLEVIIN
jgi:hypothetical protein